MWIRSEIWKTQQWVMVGTPVSEYVYIPVTNAFLIRAHFFTANIKHCQTKCMGWVINKINKINWSWNSIWEVSGNWAKSSSPTEARVLQIHSLDLCCAERRGGIGGMLFLPETGKRKKKKATDVRKGRKEEERKSEHTVQSIILPQGLLAFLFKQLYFSSCALFSINIWWQIYSC